MAEPVPVAILIEDERQIRRFVRTALEAEGWSVFETDTLRQGLAMPVPANPIWSFWTWACRTETAWIFCVICARGRRCL